MNNIEISLVKIYSSNFQLSKHGIQNGCHMIGQSIKKSNDYYVQFVV